MVGVGWCETCAYVEIRKCQIMHQCAHSVIAINTCYQHIMKATNVSIGWQIKGLICKAKWTQKRVANEFGITQGTVSKILKKERDTGDVAKRRGQGRHKKLMEKMMS